MLIAVILRQVPDTEADIVIHPEDPTRIIGDDIKWIMNPYDEFAVEAAVSTAEEHSGETLAICIGSEKAESVIRTAMAMGIDAGLLIRRDSDNNPDIISEAKVIAASLKEQMPDLILCGREYIDTGDDGIAAALAEFLHVPHVLNVNKLTVDSDQIQVEREVDGDTLRISMTLPGVVSCQKGLNEPRYPNLMAVRKAQKKPLDIKSLSDLGDDAARMRYIALSYPPARSAGRLVKGEPEDTARQAAEWLTRDARAF
ncbi:electron transfer flavoprotein subunit beta/FixA family protein [bacterium]|nr:electron transfer flavoprotein subunit beta/FixA family protein [candidate division CSSED10-310 bacterium]